MDLLDIEPDHRVTVVTPDGRYTVQRLLCRLASQWSITPEGGDIPCGLVVRTESGALSVTTGCPQHAHVGTTNLTKAETVIAMLTAHAIMQPRKEQQLRASASKWTAPDWMRPYLAHVTDSGRAEELTNGETSLTVNAPRALHEHGVLSEVALLYRLHKAGLLRDLPEGSTTSVHVSARFFCEEVPEGSEPADLKGRMLDAMAHLRLTREDETFVLTDIMVS